MPAPQGKIGLATAPIPERGRHFRRARYLVVEGLVRATGGRGVVSHGTLVSRATRMPIALVRLVGDRVGLTGQLSQPGSARVRAAA